MARRRSLPMRRDILGTAWTWESMLPLILIAVILVVLIVVLTAVNESEKQAGAETACEASVRAAAIRGYLNPTDVRDLRCTTEYTTVSAATEIEQKKVIADSLSSCWKQYGKGQLKLFPPESGDYCVICSRLEFTHPLKVNDLGDYLHDTPYPGTAQTYLMYLTNADVVAAKQAVPRGAMDTKEPLAVVFMQSKDVSNAARNWIAAGSIVGGTVLWLVTGGIATPLLIAGGGAYSAYIFSPYLSDTQTSAAVMVVPYADVAKLSCTSIEGHAGPLQYT